MIPADKKRSLSIERKIVFIKEQEFDDLKLDKKEANLSLESKLNIVEINENQTVDKEIQNIKLLKSKKSKAKKSIQTFKTKTVEEIVASQSLDKLKVKPTAKSLKLKINEIQKETNELIQKDLTLTYLNDKHLHQSIEQTSNLEIESSKSIKLQASIDLNNNNLVLINEQELLVREEWFVNDGYTFKPINVTEDLILNESLLKISENKEQFDLDYFNVDKPLEKHLKSSICNLLSSNLNEQLSLEKEGNLDRRETKNLEDCVSLNMAGELNATTVQEISKMMESETLILKDKNIYDLKRAKINLSHQNQIAQISTHQSMENINEIEIKDLKQVSNQELNEICNAYVVQESYAIEQENLADFNLLKPVNQQNLNLIKKKSYSIEHIDLLEKEESFTVKSEIESNVNEKIVLEKNSSLQSLDLGLEKESNLKRKPIKSIKKSRISFIPKKSKIIKEVITDNSLGDQKEIDINLQVKQLKKSLKPQSARILETHDELIDNQLKSKDFEIKFLEEDESGKPEIGVEQFIKSETNLQLKDEKPIKLRKPSFNERFKDDLKEQQSDLLQLADTMSISTIDSEEMDFKMESANQAIKTDLKLIENLSSIQINEIKGEEQIELIEKSKDLKEHFILPIIQSRTDAKIEEETDKLENVIELLKPKSISKVLSYLCYCL